MRAYPVGNIIDILDFLKKTNPLRFEILEEFDLYVDSVESEDCHGYQVEVA